MEKCGKLGNMKIMQYDKQSAGDGENGGVVFVRKESAKGYFSQFYSEADALIKRIGSNPTGRIEPAGDGTYVILFQVPAAGESQLKGRVCLVTDFDKRCALTSDSPALPDALFARMQEVRSYAGFLLMLIDAATLGDCLVLEELEKSVYLLEERLIEDKAPNNSVSVIVDYRKRLMRLKQYYEQLFELLDGFTSIKVAISAKESALHQNLINRFVRLLARVRDLRDGVSQLREAYQSQVDIGQNRLMKLFTTITAIFMPLQLVVGWYGMNLMMPETRFPVTYFVVIFASIALAVALILLFKRRKWF